MGKTFFNEGKMIQCTSEKSNLRAIRFSSGLHLSKSDCNMEVVLFVWCSASCWRM